MNKQDDKQLRRDTLGLVRAYATDPAGAVAMLSRLDPDEVLELTVYLLGMVRAARTVRTDLSLDDWCVLLLRHLDDDAAAGTGDPDQ